MSSTNAKNVQQPKRKSLVSVDEERLDGKVWGIPFSIRGINMAVFLALVALTGFTVWFLSVRVTEDHHTIGVALDRQSVIMEEQNYILLADEKETKAIKMRIKMPKSLREKLDQ